MSDNSVLGIYTFEGIFEGKPVYEYAYPQEHALHKCMLCHAKISTDNAEVKKVAGYAAARREIPWERVYGFDSGALVKFQHAPHIRAAVQCARCHGASTHARSALGWR